jgi:hypothetical protein
MAGAARAPASRGASRAPAGGAVFPTVDTALAARTPVFEVTCPGCQTIGSVDFRDYDIHGDAPISALIPRLSCQRCCPNPPFAVLGELLPAHGQRA